MHVKSLPLYAKRVLVPVANPATAPHLLRLASALADPDGGRVIALYVSVGNGEAQANTIERLSNVVEALARDGLPVEFMTDIATGLARGILDVAIEENADLLILGSRGAERGKAAVGATVESVARVAPCDLLVYRIPSKPIERVVIPVDGGENARVAARLGLCLADHYGVPAVAMYVESEPGAPQWLGLAKIEATLNGLPGADRVRRQLIRAADVVRGVLARCDENDLIVLGFGEPNPFERWLFGKVPQRVLTDSPGPVILTRRAVAARESWVKWFGKWLSQRVPVLTPVEQGEVSRQASEMARATISYSVLVILSSVIASLGLLQDSAGVIIGAMLVAPLMAPLMALAVGMTQGNLRLVRTATATVIQGTLLGVGIAAVVGWLLPLKVLTHEMLSRGQPSLLDMGVALASGAAGAYALARKDIPSALVGVAISAALIPPVCTVGLALAMGKIGVARGAFLLFLTNVVSIILSGAGIFIWLGVRPADKERYRYRLWMSLGLLVVLALPLAVVLTDASWRATRANAIIRALETEFGEDTLVEAEITSYNPLHVIATIRSGERIDSSDVGRARDTLSRWLGEPVELEVVVWPVVDAPE